MFRRKMTEQELRMWCVEQCNFGGKGFFMEQVNDLYEYITSQSEESKATQTKPHGCFFCRLRSRIQSWLR